jgi:SRSO17 transposase
MPTGRSGVGLTRTGPTPASPWAEEGRGPRRTRREITARELRVEHIRSALRCARDVTSASDALEAASHAWSANLVADSVIRGAFNAAAR